MSRSAVVFPPVKHCGGSENIVKTQAKYLRLKKLHTTNPSETHLIETIAKRYHTQSFPAVTPSCFPVLSQKKPPNKRTQSERSLNTPPFVPYRPFYSHSTGFSRNRNRCQPGRLVLVLHWVLQQGHPYHGNIPCFRSHSSLLWHQVKLRNA